MPRPHSLRYEAPVERLELGQDCAYLFLPNDDRTPSYRADWLIAADGAGSASRRSLGIAFEGVTYPERFLVASTTYDFGAAFENLAYVSYIHDPIDWGFLLRTPRHWRVLFPVDPSETDERACDPARVEARLQGVASLDHPYPVDHRTIYKVHQRLAARFGSGRVLLAGDAAHINNPLGGLGMNSGIQDAQAAVAAIAFALRGGDPRRAADTYARVRRDAAVNDVQQQTQRNYDAMRDGDAARAMDRKAQMATLAADPRKARAYLRRTSMLASFETSRRRLRRALTPTRPSAVEPAGQRLSDFIGEAALLYPDHVLRQLPETVREPADVVRLVAEAERDDVAAIVVPSLGRQGGAERIAAALGARRNVLLIGMVDGTDVRAAVAAGAGLVEAGADLIGLDGRLDLGTITAIHEGLREVPLALVGPDPATLPTKLQLNISVVAL